MLLPGTGVPPPAGNVEAGGNRCSCWTCKQTWQASDTRRRRAWKRAAGWSVLCGGWALIAGVVSVQGWRILGPASVCLPVVLGSSLVGLVAIAVDDVREQTVGPQEPGV